MLHTEKRCPPRSICSNLAAGKHELGLALTTGGPGDATGTLSYLIYMQTSQFFEIGYGSALAVVTLLIVAVPVILIVRREARGRRPRRLEA